MLSARLTSEDGQGIVEYGLVLAFVAISLVLSLRQYEAALGGLFASIASRWPSA